MKTLPMLAAASALALLAAPAFAQTDPAAMTVAQTTTTTTTTMTPDASAPAPDAATMAPPAAMTPTTTAADPTNVQVVTNGPIPDTPQERAKYKPLSHAGRHTAPVGN